MQLPLFRFGGGHGSDIISKCGVGILIYQVNTQKQTSRDSGPQIQIAQLSVAVSWCTFLPAYLFPMLGINAAQAVGFIQIGYCAHHIIFKHGSGFHICLNTYARAHKQGRRPVDPDSTAHRCCQLVHISPRFLDPSAWHQRSSRRFSLQIGH